MGDGMVGSPESVVELTDEQKAEAFKAELQTRHEEYMTKMLQLQERFVEPHSKKSRFVKRGDLPRLLSEAQIMLDLLTYPRGLYTDGKALAHPQIDTEDPLRFFVLPNGVIIVNPVIVNHTKAPVFKEEGCMSYPNEPVKTMLPRYNKIEMIYQTIVKDEKDESPRLSKAQRVDLNGESAWIAQHECGHFNGCHIYDKDFDPIKSIGTDGYDPLVVDMSLWDDEENVDIDLSTNEK